MEPVVRTQKQLGAALRRLRKAANLSQGEVAAATSKRQATISTLEGGTGTLDTLFSVVSALELEIVIRPRRSAKPADLTDLF